MLITLSPIWLVIVNVVAWLIIHMGVAWGGTQLPPHIFDPKQALYRQRTWENNGRLYRTVFRVHQWKRWLPDGAALFKKGFRKKRLSVVTPDYLDRFIVETCRGEAVHWVVFLCSFLFFIWNPWEIGIVMVAYGLVANFPCILAQRYNRARMNTLRFKIVDETVQ